MRPPELHPRDMDLSCSGSVDHRDTWADAVLGSFKHSDHSDLVGWFQVVALPNMVRSLSIVEIPLTITNHALRLETTFWQLVKCDSDQVQSNVRLFRVVFWLVSRFWHKFFS